MTVEYEWQEVDPGPGQFRFEDPGDELVGLLVRKERQVKYNVGWYVIRDDKMEDWGVLGSTQLDKLMSKVKVGDHIKISYIRSEKTAGGDMKIFQVFKGVIKKGNYPLTTRRSTE